LDIVSGKSEQVIRNTLRMPGVVAVDYLENPHDVMIIVEALNRQKLAELIMPILATVENITEDLRLLISRDNLKPLVIQRIWENENQILITKTALA